MTSRDSVYQRLHRIYKKYQSRYRRNPDSKQMACMWSTYRLPDTLCDTKQIEEIEKEFGIELTEDEAVELYDMLLDEAAKRIVEMQKRGKSNVQDKKE